MSKDLFINNEWQAGQAETFESVCPVSHQALVELSMANTGQVNSAVEAARESFKTWSAKALTERIEYLEHYKTLLERDKAALALIIAKEVGKPLWEAKTEVTAMINKVAISIAAYHDRTPMLDNGATRLSHRPHGVFAILGPYNFPGHLPNGHLVPALLAGNTIVFKPSELTPLVAQKMVELFEEAGFPAGVINLIQGDGSVGQKILEAEIDGVLFTGSYHTGKKIHVHFAGRPEIILALEMGGNNPLIISEVADVEAAVFTTIMSAFITSGQRCTCARRLFVPDTAWGQHFIDLLLQKTLALTVGAYHQQPEPFMGPVINEKTGQHLLDKQAAWLALGAKPLLEMKAIDNNIALLSPGLIDVTSLEQKIGDDEIFGPLLQISRYQAFEQAVSIANQTDYGLAAGLISTSTPEQEYFYHNARAGIVNINKQLTGAASNAPFGGVGFSGNHRPSAYYAADFCAYPMASMVAAEPQVLDNKPSGMNWL